MVGRGRPGDDGRVPVVGVCCGPGCRSRRPLPTISSFFAMMFKILLRTGQTREAAVTAAKKEATVVAEETGVVVAAAASGNSGYGTSRQHWQWQEQVTAAETEPVVGADDNQPKRGSDSAAETVTVAAMAAAVAAAVATEAAMAVAAVTGSNDNGSSNGSGGSSIGGDGGADSGGGGCRCGGDCGSCGLCNSRGR